MTKEYLLAAKKDIISRELNKLFEHIDSKFKLFHILEIFETKDFDEEDSYSEISIIFSHYNNGKKEIEICVLNNGSGNNDNFTDFYNNGVKWQINKNKTGNF